MPFEFEHTDTFAGQANYCWVNREVYKPKDDDKVTDRSLVIRAKRFAGFTGMRCKTEKYGDMIRITPYGMCQTVFINWID